MIDHCSVVLFVLMCKCVRDLGLTDLYIGVKICGTE